MIQIALIHSMLTVAKMCIPGYPLQTCSNICGVVTAAMSALLYEKEELWPDKAKSLPANLSWVLYPSRFSNYLRIVIMEWVITQKINTPALIASTDSDATCDSNDGQSKAALSYTKPKQDEDEIVVSKCDNSLVMSECDESSEDTESDEDVWDTESVHKLLPREYTYKVLYSRKLKSSEQFETEFKISM